MEDDGEVDKNEAADLLKLQLRRLRTVRLAGIKCVSAGGTASSSRSK